MFWSAPWDLSADIAGCQEQYAGTTPRPHAAALAYGARAALSAASNLILSNGRLDPWSSGGVTAPIPGAPPSVVVLFISEAAHHLDLRSSDPSSDPPSVLAARSTEDATMLGWLQTYYSSIGASVPHKVSSLSASL
jgi:lysosomal Pro-X carboxypeptidase